MRHLILGGGKQWDGSDEGAAWIRAVTKGRQDIKAAFCHFARPESEWNDASSSTIQFITKFAATHDTQTLTHQNFKEVSAWAEVIWVTGGDPELLMEQLKKHENPENLWQGKTIAGTSAGADMMCKDYVYLQSREVGQGFGWLDMNVLVHWRSGFADWQPEEWADYEERLTEDRQLLCLGEGEFAEFVVK